MDQSTITIQRLIEELRGAIEQKGINSTPDQGIALNEAQDRLDGVEESISAMIMAFNE